MDNIQLFVKTLAGEIGYKETGYNNNIYAKYMDENYPQFYGGKKNGFPWCCIFIHAIMCQLFGYDNLKTLTGLKENNSGAGCQGCANGYLSIGRRIRGKENLQVGDQVIFGNCSYDHTGVIYDVIDSKKGIYLTIEGNYMDSVSVVKRYYNEMSFVGRPNWDSIEE